MFIVPSWSLEITLRRKRTENLFTTAAVSSLCRALPLLSWRTTKVQGRERGKYEENKREITIFAESTWISRSVTSSTRAQCYPLQYAKRLCRRETSCTSRTAPGSRRVSSSLILSVRSRGVTTEVSLRRWWPTSMVGCQQPLTCWTLLDLDSSDHFSVGGLSTAHLWSNLLCRLYRGSQWLFLRHRGCQRREG